MTNNAWHKLCNEWCANSINDEFRAVCKRLDIDPDEIFATRTEDMKFVRKECKKKYVWLEDTCEADIYIELMPFGGYTEDGLRTLRECLDHYRKAGRPTTLYRAICGG